MEVSVYNIQGKTTGKKVTLADQVFSIEPNEHAVYLDVKQYLANQRQGTHKTKERPEVAYSTRKLLKQKGTGGARHGSRKANIYVGGGRVFGPKPHLYGFKVNKKTKDVARRSVLSSKLKDNLITVVEDFSFDFPKTKSFVNVMEALSLSNRKSLLILGHKDKNVVLSGRNLPKVSITTADSINTYQLMNTDVILISESAVQVLNQL